MSVYRKTRGSAGSAGRAHARNWTVQFTDHNALRHEIPAGTPDKSLARAFESRIRRLIAYRRHAEPLPAELVEWLTRQPAATIKRLRELDLIPDQRLTALVPIRDHVADWKADLLALRRKPSTVELVTARAQSLLNQAGASYWTDIESKDVLEALAKLDCAEQTRLHYWRAVVQFCRWVVKRYDLPKSPLSGSSPRLTPDHQRPHERRHLSQAESIKLVKATLEGGKSRGGMSAEARGLAYWLALETGLRRNEISTLTAASFRMGSLPARIVVESGYSKRRKRDTVYVMGPLADRLADFVVDLDPEARPFVMPRHTARIIRADMDDAGIDHSRDDHNRVVDFHSLRHTFITNIVDSGTPMHVAKELARHSTVKLTERYSHSTPRAELEALRRLPKLAPKQAAS